MITLWLCAHCLSKLILPFMAAGSGYANVLCTAAFHLWCWLYSQNIWYNYHFNSLHCNSSVPRCTINRWNALQITGSKLQDLLAVLSSSYQCRCQRTSRLTLQWQLQGVIHSQNHPDPSRVLIALCTCICLLTRIEQPRYLECLNLSGVHISMLFQNVLLQVSMKSMHTSISRG